MNNNFNNYSNYNNNFNGNYNNHYKGYNHNNVMYREDGIAKHMAKTYLWMFVGLAITFGLSLYMTLNSDSVIGFINNHSTMYFGATIISLVLVIVIGFTVYKLPVTIAKIIFIIYAADMGIIITPLLLMYSLSSVVTVFGATSIIYLALAIIGFTTKKDVSKLGPLLTISLIGVLLYSLISYFFIRTPFNNLVINAIVVLIFMGFTLYDNHMIKKRYKAFQGNPQLLEKISILSALNLYLDFINLFIRLLAIFGKRRD